jgi:hypothetical protein
MKHVLMCSVLTLLTLATNAQTVATSKEFSYTVSQPYEVVDGVKQYWSKNGEVLSLKYGGGSFYFQRFSGDRLNETKRVQAEKEEGFTIESFEELNGKYYFFFSRWDKKNTTEQLFVREVDFDKCNWAGPERLVIKVKGKVTGGFSVLYGGTGKFNFLRSFDNSVMAIQYRLRPEEKNDALNKDVIGMHVFDKDLEEMWAHDVQMPYTEKKMNNIAYTVDKLGNTYILAEIYKDETTKRVTSSGAPNFRMEIIRVDKDDQSLSNTEVELKSKFITNLGFFEGRTGNLILAGYYGNKNNGGTDGLFMFNVDENGEISEAQTAEIPVAVMSKYISEKAKDKMEKKESKGADLAMTNMVLRGIVYDKQGNFTMYGEEYYTVTTYNASTKTYQTKYYYEDILVARFNADGEIVFMDKLPKRQVGGAGRGGMGFYTMVGDGVEYVLYLDNVKNLNLPEDKYPAWHSDGQGGFLTGYKIDQESGSLTKVSLFDLRDAKGVELFQFNTGRIVKLSDSEFAVECYKKQKEDVMIKVTMKD